MFNNFSAVCFFSPCTAIKLNQQVVQSRRWKRIPFVTTLQSYRDLKMKVFSFIPSWIKAIYIEKDYAKYKNSSGCFLYFLVAFSQVWLFLSLMVIEIILTGKHNQDRRYGMLKIKPKLHKLWQPLMHVNVKVEQD